VAQKLQSEYKNLFGSAHSQWPIINKTIVQ